MPLKLVKDFNVIIARHTSQRGEIERALLILELIKFNPSETARRLGCNREKAHRWYHRATRTSEDFTLLIENTVKIKSEGTWIFVADQLNTHKSE